MFLFFLFKMQLRIDICFFFSICGVVPFIPKFQKSNGEVDFKKKNPFGWIFTNGNFLPFIFESSNFFHH